MGTQLILTVGTNPLPIWVAWYHLKEELPKPVCVRLVHTENTRAEKDRLVDCFQDTSLLDPIEISEGDPEAVHNGTRRISGDLSAEISDFHIHYTGGTKVMGVETVSATEAQLRDSQNVRLQTSYLNPRGALGPTIESRQGPLVRDTRQNVDLEFNLIARLNGFTLGPFEHRYRDRETGRGETVVCPAPGILNQEQLREGWDAIQSNTGEHIPGELLEYGAYAAFKDALDEISRNNPGRNNCKLFHSVHVQRDIAIDRNIKHFELDVVAVLGYQIVVVSCTVDSRQDMVKQKGMEAILRARQLGGDDARAIVLCSTDQNSAKLVEDELRDEMGSTSEPLQIWGRNRWRGLTNNFCRYLRNDLHWK